jgi:hypothetical protein
MLTFMADTASNWQCARTNSHNTQCPYGNIIIGMQSNMTRNTINFHSEANISAICVTLCTIIFQLTMCCPNHAVTFLSGHSKAVLWDSQLWSSIMQGKQNWAWTKGTIQPTRYRFPSPVTAFIKFLLKTVSYCNNTWREEQFTWNILGFLVNITRYRSWNIKGGITLKLRKWKLEFATRQQYLTAIATVHFVQCNSIFNILRCSLLGIY